MIMKGDISKKMYDICFNWMDPEYDISTFALSLYSIIFGELELAILFSWYKYNIFAWLIYVFIALGGFYTGIIMIACPKLLRKNLITNNYNFIDNILELYCV
jgi:hypothetical protein